MSLMTYYTTTEIRRFVGQDYCPGFCTTCDAEALPEVPAHATELTCPVCDEDTVSSILQLFADLILENM